MRDSASSVQYLFTKRLPCARVSLEFWTPGASALKIRNSGAAKAKKGHFFPKRTPDLPTNGWNDPQGLSKAGNESSNIY